MAAGLGEAGGGVLIAAGFVTPAAAAAVAGTMAVAASMHADNGFFAQDGGLEYPAVLGLVAGALALTGPGDLSIDAATGYSLNRSWMRTVALASIPPVVTATVLRRRRSLRAATAVKTTPSEPAS